MSSLCYELPGQEVIFTGKVPTHSIDVEAGVEKSLQINATTGAFPIISQTSAPTMAPVPVDLTDFLVEQFRFNENVRALMIGKSGDVHHVWVLLDDWNPSQRKEIYATQREILKKVAGFNFDFYVVDIPAGTSPKEMVSGIPIAYERN